MQATRRPQERGRRSVIRVVSQETGSSLGAVQELGNRRRTDPLRRGAGLLDCVKSMGVGLAMHIAPSSNAHRDALFGPSVRGLFLRKPPSLTP